MKGKSSLEELGRRKGKNRGEKADLTDLRARLEFAERERLAETGEETPIDVDALATGFDSLFDEMENAEKTPVANPTQIATPAPAPVAPAIPEVSPAKKNVAKVETKKVLAVGTEFIYRNKKYKVVKGPASKDPRYLLSSPGSKDQWISEVLVERAFSEKGKERAKIIKPETAPVLNVAEKEPAPVIRERGQEEAKLEKEVSEAKNLEELLKAILSVEYIRTSTGDVPSNLLNQTINLLINKSPEELGSRENINRVLKYGGVTSNFGIREKAVEFLSQRLETTEPEVEWTDEDQRELDEVERQLAAFKK